MNVQCGFYQEYGFANLRLLVKMALINSINWLNVVEKLAILLARLQVSGFGGGAYSVAQSHVHPCAAKSRTQPERSASSGRPKTARGVLFVWEAAGDPNLEDRQGNTPLHTAIAEVREFHRIAKPGAKMNFNAVCWFLLSFGNCC